MDSLIGLKCDIELKPLTYLFKKRNNPTAGDYWLLLTSSIK
ncbi:hypothetical protein LV84_02527 [Algoriphagus ratkowskyi]|uniref:Uncharacterized protein n=1 Tax=Algoriphagus ratkowskyi TaxID=57028 RepID=A0A2W7RLD2_9BACT|nr:hypothetical protein LV84_02527 [Algoriphagus ratkowskyi]